MVANGNINYVRTHLGVGQTMSSYLSVSKNALKKHNTILLTFMLPWNYKTRSIIAQSGQRGANNRNFDHI